MKSSNFRGGYLLILLTCSLRAVAGSQDDGFTLGSLEKIQEETLFDQAQLEHVRARNELDKYRQTAQPQPAAEPAEIPGHQSTGMHGGAAYAPAPLSTPSESTPPAEAALPMVIQIWGSRRHLNAQLQMPDGKRLTVDENTILPGDLYRVIAITPREVRISTGHGSPKNLAFIGGVMINRQDSSAYIYIDRSADEPTVYFSEAHRHDPLTTSVLAGILRQTPQARFEPVQLDELRQLQSEQQSGQVTSEISRSEQQSRVIRYFRQAVTLGASDIHLLIGYQEVTLVQLRIHGQLRTIAQLEREEGMQLAATIVLSMCDVTEKSFNANRAQDGRLRSEFVRQLGIFGARYAHTPAEFGLYVVMRVLPDDSSSLPTPDQLGFLPVQQQQITRMLTRPEGIIIISGPTGSGKSTSLRCFSRCYLEQTLHSKRLFTIEDPPEGMIPGAVQTPVIADRTDPEALSQAWSRGISSALRLDPDAMIIGEIRDTNSVRAALSAAKSGHLVQTTLHANDAIGILDRLTDTLQIPLPEIADAQLVIGLIAQRLVPVLCPSCKLSWQQKLPSLSAEQREFLTRHCDAEKLCFRHSSGCSACFHGTVGRKMIAEVIRPDARFMELYRHEGKIAARRYWLDTLNGITRTAHLKDYLHQGVADPLDADLISPLDEDDLMQPSLRSQA